METNLELPNSSSTSTSTSINIHADILSPPNSSSTSTINNGDDFLSPPSSTSNITNGSDSLSPPASTSDVNNGDNFLSPTTSTSNSTSNNGGDILSPPTSTINNGGGEFLSPPTSTPAVNNGGNEEEEEDEQNDDDDDEFYNDDSNCSTPYVSAPSSPGRYSYLPSSGFFYSAPTSPMHFILANANSRSSLLPAISDASSTSNNSFEFEFSARFDSPTVEIGSSMCSADELFLNGQIRPMKLCAHLQRPQKLPSMTLLESQRENDDDYDDDDDEFGVDDVFRSSRDLRYRSRSQRRRTRSLSPLRSTTPFEWKEERESRGKNEQGAKEKEGDGEGEGEGEGESETTPSGSSSRCSSAGRSSKRWVFLKDFLRSKSEGRSNNKFWQNINMSFSPAKEKREREKEKGKERGNVNAAETTAKKESPGVAKGKGKRRSAHEVHYAANRAQAEELRKKTFLPYRQGLLGCLGFNSRSYGALNGFARALNPVSSR